MFPFLTAAFGKQIAANLCRLGEESKEIKGYFHALNRPILAAIEKDSERNCLNLNAYLPMPSIQLKYLFMDWLGREKVTLSRQIIEGMVSALNASSLRKKFCSKEGEFYVDKGCVYLSIKSN